MPYFKNFPPNENDIAHQRGFHKKSGASTRYGSGVVLYFANSKPYTCVYEILYLEKYLLAVRTDRYLTVGYDDMLGYEINGEPVYLPPYYELTKND